MGLFLAYLILLLIVMIGTRPWVEDAPKMEIPVFMLALCPAVNLFAAIIVIFMRIGAALFPSK